MIIFISSTLWFRSFRQNVKSFLDKDWIDKDTTWRKTIFRRTTCFKVAKYFEWTYNMERISRYFCNTDHPDRALFTAITHWKMQLDFHSPLRCKEHSPLTKLPGKNTHAHICTQNSQMSHNEWDVFHMPPTLKFHLDKLARLYLIFDGEFSLFWRCHREMSIANNFENINLTNTPFKTGNYVKCLYSLCQDPVSDWIIDVYHSFSAYL